MNDYSDELDSIAKSFEKQINKYFFLSKLSIILFISLFLIYIIAKIFKYQFSDTIDLIVFIIFIILYLIIGISYSKSKSVFNNIREKIFYFLYQAWKHHNEESGKKYLKKVIDELDTHLYEYKVLAYTEEIYSTLDSLRKTLIHHIYPKIAKREPILDEGELTTQAAAWEIFKSLAIDFYQSNRIEIINSRNSELKVHFPEQDETVNLDNSSLNKISNFINNNINLYNHSIFCRFIFFTTITVILDIILIIKLDDPDILMAGTVTIPILAPYYLVSTKYK